MRKRLLAALCCIMMLLPFAATAETELVPQLSAWQLEESASPIRVTASAQMSAWVPFDDTMLEALNTLLSHMSVQVDTMNLSGEMWSKTALLLEGRLDRDGDDRGPRAGHERAGEHDPRVPRPVLDPGAHPRWERTRRGGRLHPEFPRQDPVAGTDHQEPERRQSAESRHR